MRRVEGRVKGQKKEEKLWRRKSQGKGEQDRQSREERSVEKRGAMSSHT